MTIKTHIFDKDGELEDSITTLQQKLLEAGFNIVEEICLNPIDNVWSMDIRERDCKLLFANGKGTSKQAALASALRVFCERLSSHYFWADCYLGAEISNHKFIQHPKEEWFKTNLNGSWPEGVFDGPLGADLREFYNPDEELNPSNLIDINSVNHGRGICCIPYECLRTGEIVNFPINIISNIYDSNGISAGNNPAKARVYALSEILQRFIQFKIIAEGISLPDIPDEVLNRYSAIPTGIQEIQNAGFSLLVQDASLGGKYPVIAMILLNSHNQGVHVGFGAHPKFEVALEQSLTGLFQGRSLDQLNGFAEAGFDMDEIASIQNLEKHFLDSSGIVSWNFLNEKSNYDFFDWDKQDSTSNDSEEFKQLSDIIHAEGNDIFIFEHNDIGFYSCQVVVPGMSEIYPAEDLVWENNNAGKDIREQILKTDKTHSECEQLIIELEELNLDDHYLVSKLIGMPSDAECIFNDLCIAELVTLLALKVQDNERIQEGCEWLLDFQNINLRRLKTYKCINTLLQLDGMTNYGAALGKLYTRSILNDALALIDGEDVFPLVSDWKVYNSMVEAYKKLIKIKANHNQAKIS